MKVDNYGKKIINITSYIEFKEIFNILNEKDYYYRGQADPTWLLESSFQRLYKKFNKIGKEIDEESMITKSISNEEYFKNLEKLSILDIIAIMQHYGTHTRFIDFTTCPFVASYFAIREFNLSKDENGIYTSAVHMINKKIVNKNEIPLELKEPVINNSKFKKILFNFKKFSSENNEYIYTYEPSIINKKRIINQKSLFIFFTHAIADVEKQIIVRNNWNMLSVGSGDISDIDKMHKNTGYIKIIFKLNKENLCDFFNLLKKEKNICEYFLFDGEEGFFRSLNYEFY